MISRLTWEPLKDIASMPLTVIHFHLPLPPNTTLAHSGLRDKVPKGPAAPPLMGATLLAQSLKAWPCPRFLESSLLGRMPPEGHQVRLQCQSPELSSQSWVPTGILLPEAD